MVLRNGLGFHAISTTLVNNTDLRRVTTVTRDVKRRLRPGAWKDSRSALVGVGGQTVVAVGGDVVVFLAGLLHGVDVYHGPAQVAQVVQ